MTPFDGQITAGLAESIRHVDAYVAVLVQALELLVLARCDQSKHERIDGRLRLVFVNTT